MRKYAICVICFSLIVLIGCSNQFSTPEKTVNLFYSAQKTGDQQKWESCFTDETRELLEKYWALSDNYDEEKRIKKSPDISWEILDVHVDNFKADVKVKVNSQNGNNVLMIELKSEKNKWKIDRSEYLKKAIEMRTEEKILRETLK